MIWTDHSQRSFDFPTLRMAWPRISTFAVIWRRGAARYSILAAAPACWRRRWPGDCLVVGIDPAAEMLTLAEQRCRGATARPIYADISSGGSSSSGNGQT